MNRFKMKQILNTYYDEYLSVDVTEDRRSELKPRIDELEELIRKTKDNDFLEKIIVASVPVVITVAGTIGVALINNRYYDKWHREGLQFEEEGVWSSVTNKNLESRLLPKK